MSFAVTDPPFCRLTVLAPRTRVHVALPVDLPVAELVPMVLELVGEPAPGGPPQPWRLFAAGGRALPAGATLPELGVRDGDLLRLAPDRPAPPPPMFDDPVEALAVSGRPEAVAGGRFRSVAVRCSAGRRRRCSSAGRPRPLLDLAGPADRPGSGSALVLIAALAAVAGLAGAAWLVRRPASRPETAAPPTEAHPTDITRPARWPASVDPSPTTPHRDRAWRWPPFPWPRPWGGWRCPRPPTPSRLLLAAVAAGGAAAAAQAALRLVHPVLVGVLVGAVPTGLAALAVTRLRSHRRRRPWAPARSRWWPVRCYRGPRCGCPGCHGPLVPGDAGELVAADHGPDLLPPAELAARADLARSYLAGLVGGCAVVAGAAALPAATVPGWTGPALAAATVALLGLRARSFVDPGPARALAGSALLAGIGLAMVLAWSGAPWARPAAALGLLLTAAALGCAGFREPGPPAPRFAGGRSTSAKALLTALVLPLAFGALDLYRLIRSL